MNNLLRESDNGFYQQYKNLLLDIGITIVSKVQIICQRRYGQKRARQINIQFRALQDVDTTQAQITDIH